MHELSIAEDILTTAKSHSREGTRVTHIRVALGPFSGVVRESLEFCFGLAAGHFGMDGAQLEIEQLSAPGICPACSTAAQVDSMWTACAACGHSPLTVEGGRELIIRQLVIEEDDNV